MRDFRTLIPFVLVLPLTMNAQTAGRPPVLPATAYSYAAPAYPAHFSIDPLGPAPAVLATDSQRANVLTDAGAALGRVLFYDVLLSRNNTVSCASCHVQEQGFGDARRLSLGFAGGTTRRHSMGLSNARFNPGGRMFWDERAATVEDQVLRPIQDQTEMGMTLPEVVQRVEAQSYYPALFQAAFGTPGVTADRISQALAQFVRSLVSYRSKYDVGRAQVDNAIAPFPNFTAQENRGKDLFMLPRGGGGQDCAACHRGEVFIADDGPINNGLDLNTTNDEGAFEASGNPAQRGAFRVPSLRNIARRAPYMHDGRFQSLQAVLNFYENNVQAHPNLDARLKQPNGQPVRARFGNGDEAAMIAFLGTLTDEPLLSEARFSNPFRALRSLAAGSLRAERAAPESIVAGFAADLATSATAAPGNPVTPLGGIRVVVRDSQGVERDAPLYYVGLQQVNYLVPAGTAAGLAEVRVVNGNNIRSRGTLDVAAVVPSLFTANGSGSGVPAAYAVSRDASGQLRSLLVSSSRVGLDGDLVLELYGTGLRGAKAVTATIGNVAAEVLYAGPQGITGLDQVNVRVPPSLAGRGTVDLILTADGVAANAVQLTF